MLPFAGGRQRRQDNKEEAAPQVRPNNAAGSLPGACATLVRTLLVSCWLHLKWPLCACGRTIGGTLHNLQLWPAKRGKQRLGTPHRSSKTLARSNFKRRGCMCSRDTSWCGKRPLTIAPVACEAPPHKQPLTCE